MIVAGMTMNASVGAMEMYGAPFMNNLSDVAVKALLGKA
jgi:hypothetical protein